MFDILFSLDRGASRIEHFEIDEPIDSVVFRVALREPVPMLINAPDEIIRDADVQCAAGPTSQECTDSTVSSNLADVMAGLVCHPDLRRMALLP